MDPLPRVDALIFDLDGTLADSVADIGTAANAVLARYHFPPQELVRYRDWVGEGGAVLMRRVFKTAVGLDWRDEKVEGLPAPLPRLALEYGEAYEQVGHQFSAPYAGIPELLQGIAASGRRMAVLSNKRDDFSKKLVKLLFPGAAFTAVFGEREGVPKKPDPTAAFELALALNVLPDKVGFVGDTAIDMGTARNAGMVALGAGWGFRPAELLPSGARRVFETPSELLQALRG
jgi:phosphoglycolate phosphatase